MQTVFCWALVMQVAGKVAATLIIIFLFPGMCLVIKIRLILMALEEATQSFAQAIILVCSREVWMSKDNSDGAMKQCVIGHYE